MGNQSYDAVGVFQLPALEARLKAIEEQLASNPPKEPPPAGTWQMTADDAAMVHRALYLQYGNGCAAVWHHFRKAMGTEWLAVVARSEAVEYQRIEVRPDPWT